MRWNLTEQIVLHGLKTVRVVEEWDGNWFKLGATYQVTRYPYRATRGGTVACCTCLDCLTYRAGLRLYDMYVVASGPDRGSIIPMVCCA